jgi:hypothetical protein
MGGDITRQIMKAGTQSSYSHINCDGNFLYRDFIPQDNKTKIQGNVYFASDNKGQLKSFYTMMLNGDKSLWFTTKDDEIRQDFQLKDMEKKIIRLKFLRLLKVGKY